MPNYGGINSGLKNRPEKSLKVLIGELVAHHKKKLQAWHKKPLPMRIWISIAIAIIVISIIAGGLIFDHLQNVGLRYLPPRS